MPRAVRPVRATVASWDAIGEIEPSLRSAGIPRPGQEPLDRFEVSPVGDETHRDLIASESGSERSSHEAVPRPNPTPALNPSGAGPSPLYTFYERFGWLTETFLFGGSLCVLATLGWLWFFWLADYRTALWHTIVIRGWTTRAVSIPSIILRASFSFTASVATSMLASLALERGQVLLLHVASTSVMRTSNGGPYLLAWHVLKTFFKDQRRWKNLALFALVILITITTALSEFTSTALLSDIQVSVIPGTSQTFQIATNFVPDSNNTLPVVNRGSAWPRKPPVFPTFAEYHDPASESRDGQSVDTGQTIRAFLPIRDQQSRALLRTYSGTATVLDARVKCQRPDLTAIRAHYSFGFLGLTANTSIDGQEQPVVCLTPLLQKNSIQSPQWPLSLCQYGNFVNSSMAPMASVFRSNTSTLSYGMTYLALNVSSGTDLTWPAVIGQDTGEFDGFANDGYPASNIVDRGEWQDLLWTSNGSLTLSVSLCYAALDAVDLHIDAFGPTNRTEPNPAYDPTMQIYRYDAIRQQFGQTRDRNDYTQSPAQRGIVLLTPPSSWQVPPNTTDKIEGASFIREALDMGAGVFGSYITMDLSSKGFNYSGFLHDSEPTTSTSKTWSSYARILADPSVSALIQEILQQGGSIAFAVQSLITAFAGMTYYDQLEQFNQVSSISQTPYVVFNVPRHKRGLIAVTIVVGIHSSLILIIFYLFLTKSSLSAMGNAWQTLAQVRGVEVGLLLDKAPLATDDKVEAEVVVKHGWKERMVVLTPSEDSSSPVIVSVEDRELAKRRKKI